MEKTKKLHVWEKPTQNTGILQSITGRNLKFLVMVSSRKCPVTLTAKAEVVQKAVPMIGKHVRFNVLGDTIIDVEEVKP